MRDTYSDQTNRVRSRNNNERYENEQQRRTQQNSGYADRTARERTNKQTYEYDSAERVGRYVKIVD